MSVDHITDFTIYPTVVKYVCSLKRKIPQTIYLEDDNLAQKHTKDKLHSRLKTSHDTGSGTHDTSDHVLISLHERTLDMTMRSTQNEQNE